MVFDSTICDLILWCLSHSDVFSRVVIPFGHIAISFQNSSFFTPLINVVHALVTSPRCEVPLHGSKESNHHVLCRWDLLKIEAFIFYLPA